ncbi:hypothetical protein AX15_003740 [Amanita polypyramis BW_CC]|nr:hypothetical protein AX15_003740 [Amanita polypyramis BW_CC]
MSVSKCTSAALSPVHPPLGTLIDGHSLELVEVLGVGGYGVVYRAVDIDPLSLTGHLKSYAVKCLVTPSNASSRQRHVHIREIALHQLASVHPGVVTLHRVIEQQNVTYIILDYAPDHDLFTQILRNCRYLGNDDLIRHIFLQLLDAVEYCHMLGIYHRDLKPENVLCFDDGLRVAITDFGLATTEKMSDEFRTGSVYHMSPECQGGEFAPDGYYSPQANDVWSLGIVLLNLATGRNPWKSATAADPTFQAYLHDPLAFLPSVLPISRPANDLLLRMLDVNWRTRITLPEVRRAVRTIRTFYCDGVIFEGSMARCPWEAGMDLDSEEDEEVINDIDDRATGDWRRKTGVFSVDESSSSSSSSSEEDYGDSTSKSSRAIADSLAGIPPRSTKSALVPAVTETSRWSADSETSEIIFASRSPSLSFGEEDMLSAGALWTDIASSKATWGCGSSMSPSSPIRKSTYGYPPDVEFRLEDGPDSDTSREPYVHVTRSEKVDFVFPPLKHHIEDKLVEKKPELTLNTHLDAFGITPIQGFYLTSDGMSMASISTRSSETMQTAYEYENYSSSSLYFLADSSTLHSPKSSYNLWTESLSSENSTYEDPSDAEMASPIKGDSIWRSSSLTHITISKISSPSRYSVSSAALSDSDLGEGIWRSSSLTHISISRISSPSRHSVSSAALSPLRFKWSGSNLGEESGKQRLSYFNPSTASGWSTTYCAASVKTGGIRSPYYSFRRSNAPSPEESALRVVRRESIDVTDTCGSDMVVSKIREDESQPTFHVDELVKLTNNGDSPLRPNAETPLDASRSDAWDVPERRLEPQRFFEAQSVPSEKWQKANNRKPPMQIKSGRSAALFNAMRFLSRAGSPTPQTPSSSPHTSDAVTSKKLLGTSSTVQETLPSNQDQAAHTGQVISATPTPVSGDEGSTPKRLLSTRDRSPIRAGTIPASLSRNCLSPTISRMHPRRATVHIGSIFHRPMAESDQPSIRLSTLAAAAEAIPSLPDQSPPSTPEATDVSSSTSTSPPATPSRPCSPERIASPQTSSPATTTLSTGPFRFIPGTPPMKTRSPPAPARNRRWTVNGWTKVSSLVIPDRRHVHDTPHEKTPADPPVIAPTPYSLDAVSKIEQTCEADRPTVPAAQRNECSTFPWKSSVQRRRGWLPNLLGKNGVNGFDLHKVVKIPIEAGKWLGSLSGGSSRSNGLAKNAGIIWWVSSASNFESSVLTSNDRFLLFHICSWSTRIRICNTSLVFVDFALDLVFIHPYIYHAFITSQSPIIISRNFTQSHAYSKRLCTHAPQLFVL